MKTRELYEKNFENANTRLVVANIEGEEVFAFSSNNNTIYFDEYKLSGCERYYNLYNKGLLIARIRCILSFNEHLDYLELIGSKKPQNLTR